MFRIGAFELTSILDLVVEEPMSLFPGWNDQVLQDYGDWFDPAFFNASAGHFNSSIHSWLVRGPRQTVLIDTGGGNNKPRPASPRFDNLKTSYLASFKRAGVHPEEVDYVILTHLHVDHIGWNTKLVNGQWVPTFPNARYLMTRAEYDLRDPANGARDRPATTHLPFIDSIAPLLAAGVVDFIDSTTTAELDGISFLPSPGHVRDQLAISLRAGDAEAFFAADSLHQPIQVRYPGWNSKYCEDGPTAIATRHRLLAHVAETGGLLLPSHFARPGYVRADGTGYTFHMAEEF
ncbi:MBL fold metallo-hydrolase [Devosia alba]|uniref:MBL fold metallo-hydrolase n=1 Tax=Devosia alba TaxID=3152360 RepID=UPI0032631EE0